MNQIIQKLVADKMGFITKQELVAVVAADRLTQCLIRFGGCRLTCAAQDVAHVIECMEASGKDYVRDVSLIGFDNLEHGGVRPSVNV